jgi:ubiquinone/menaquinone biosynthesis C-methylase UbiE
MQERFLRFFNRVLYNALAPAYDALDWLTLGTWWRLVSRALDYVPADQRVLEIGFGPGKLHVHLARRSSLCVGLDLAPGMCRIARHKLARAGLKSGITRGSVFTLPYPANAFDTVVSTFAFSGLPNGGAALREMARVIRPGGQIVLVDIGLPRDHNRVGVFWARLWERMGDYLYDQPALMAQAGLNMITFDEFGPGRHIRAVVGKKPA